MVNNQQLALLQQGINSWNHWREENPEIWPQLVGADLHSCNLSGANLMGADLRQVNFSGANLSGAYLSEADLFEADLSYTNLSEAYLFEANLNRSNLNGADIQNAYLARADLRGAYLIGANLSGADLRGAYLIGANLSDVNMQGASLIQADLQGADFRGANLAGASLIGSRLLKTNFDHANLSDCFIYGISAWGLNLEGANQSNLIITLPNQPSIAIDTLDVAQFIHLFLDNPSLRDIIYKINSKIVLILIGLRPPEKQELLEVIRQEIRRYGYLPVVFDFKKLASRDVATTILNLASISRFAIADITNAKSIVSELQRIVAQLPFVPIQPIAQILNKEHLMFDAFQKYPSVLPTYYYDNIENLLTSFSQKVIIPVETMAKKLENNK